MKMLAAALGVVTTITLVSACAYQSYPHYVYGYGPGYYGSYYTTTCWYDRFGFRQCFRA